MPKRTFTVKPIEIGDLSALDLQGEAGGIIGVQAYRITIYDGVNAADVVKNPDGSIDPSMLNRTDVIYEVWGYIDGGNKQIHLLTGFDR